MLYYRKKLFIPLYLINIEITRHHRIRMNRLSFLQNIPSSIAARNMRQDQFFNIGLDSQFGALFRSEMRELICHFRFFFEIRGFDHERVRVFADLEQVIRSTGITHYDEFDSLFNRSQHIVRRNAFAIR